MVHKMSQQRFITIAGSAALVAIAAFGIWKWSKTDSAPEGRKKKDRQVDKDFKQSHSPTSTKDTIKELERIVQENEVKTPVEPVKTPTEQVKTESVEVVKQVQTKPTQEFQELQEIINVIEKELTIETSTVEIEEETEPETKAEEINQNFKPMELTMEEDAMMDEPESSQAMEQGFSMEEPESSQVLVDAESLLVEEKVTKVEEEEYVMVGKTIKKQETQSCATSSGDETGVWTPEHEPENKVNTPKTTNTQEYIWKADSTTTNNNNTMDEERSWDAPIVSPATNITTYTSRPLSSDAAVFVPRRQVQPRKNARRRLTRAELIQQQRQNYTPHAKARCSHWPCCTNKNCKFWHPFRDCREGETCPFGNKCMFIHPSDYLEPVRGHSNNNTTTQEED